MKCRKTDVVGCYDVASEQLRDPALILWIDEQGPHKITAIAITRCVVLIIWDSGYTHK